MKKKKNLMDFMKRIITGFMKEGRPGTAHVYQSTYNRILDFMGGRPMDFAELTPSWLKAFQNYLLSRQLQWNSISTYMRMLRAVYFRAVDQGLVSAWPRLFHGVYTGTRVTVKRAIDAGLLRRLQKPLPEHTGLEKARKLSSVLGQKTSLSSYSARHSWATLANFCDYQQELISNAMGHSSVKVTETYFQRHTDDRIHAMNRGVLSYVFRNG